MLNHQRKNAKNREGESDLKALHAFFKRTDYVPVQVISNGTKDPIAFKINSHLVWTCEDMPILPLDLLNKWSRFKNGSCALLPTFVDRDNQIKIGYGIRNPDEIPGFIRSYNAQLKLDNFGSSGESFSEMTIWDGIVQVGKLRIVFPKDSKWTLQFHRKSLVHVTFTSLPLNAGKSIVIDTNKFKLAK